MTSDVALVPLRPGAAGPGRRRRLRAPVLVGAVVAAATVVLANVDPHTPGRYGICPSVWLMDVYCPGCGALRATFDLAHLDVAGAWSMNPLWVLAAPVVVAAWVAWLRRAWHGRQLGAMTTPMWVVPLVAVLGYTVLRNLPVFAPWLAPGGVLP